MYTNIIIVMVCVAVYSLLAKRLSSTIFTAPIIFMALGYALSFSNTVGLEQAETILHLVAEAALIILLFADASMINFAALRKRNIWPQRMLLIGLPLALLFGTGVASILLPSWSIFAVALVASILAPTDAALGQAVISNVNVPERERRTFIIESGLNDGLALPVVLFFACTLATIEGEHDSNFLLFVIQQLTLGPGIGILLGWLGGHALMHAHKRGLSESHFEGVAAIAIAVAAYVGASMVDGNGFIAAFCAGMTFGKIAQPRIKHVQEFVESEGQILVWASFFLIGLVLLPEALHHLTWATLILILLSLFVVRPLAIYLSLIGTDAKPTTRLFFGWFGPRGLATALFALLVVGEINQTYAEQVLMIAINAVWISTLLHGFSAAPGANWYANNVSKKNS